MGLRKWLPGEKEAYHRRENAACQSQKKAIFACEALEREEKQVKMMMMIREQTQKQVQALRERRKEEKTKAGESISKVLMAGANAHCCPTRTSCYRCCRNILFAILGEEEL
jgi:hypothetical protein